MPLPPCPCPVKISISPSPFQSTASAPEISWTVQGFTMKMPLVEEVNCGSALGSAAVKANIVLELTGDEVLLSVPIPVHKIPQVGSSVIDDRPGARPNPFWISKNRIFIRAGVSVKQKAAIVGRVVV